MKKMLRKMAGFFSRRTRKRNLYSSRSGAVSMEYLLIAALVAAALIVVAIKFKNRTIDTVVDAQNKIATESGNDNSNQVQSNGSFAPAGN